MPSRAGFPISLSPSGLEAPSSLPSFLGAAPWVSFLRLPAGMRHSFLLLCVSGGSAPCYLLLLPEGLGSPFHSSVSPLHITAGTLRSPVPLGMGSPRSLPVPQGLPSPRGLSHPPTQCVFFSFPEGISVGRTPACPPPPTKTETLPLPRHLVVAASSLLPFEGRWRLPLSSHLPPPPQRRKTLGHPSVAGRLHLG